MDSPVVMFVLSSGVAAAFTYRIIRVLFFREAEVQEAAQHLARKYRVEAASHETLRQAVEAYLRACMLPYIIMAVLGWLGIVHALHQGI